MPRPTPQHESPSRRNDEGEDDVELQQPGPRRRARLPAPAARRGRHPHPRSALVHPPPAVALTTHAVTAAALDPSLDLSEARATIDDVPRWDDGPLVGRAEELDHLLTHVDQAVEGRGSAVLVAGDAGVGKSRLLDELMDRARGHGVRVLIGHCVDLGDVGLPYLPFVDLLRPVAAQGEAAPAAARHPALAGLLAGRPDAL